jgi:hypothetical protein
MAHFNQASHTASGALATSGMRSLLEAIIPVLPEAEQNCLSAKQRRLSQDQITPRNYVLNDAHVTKSCEKTPQRVWKCQTMASHE